MSPKRRGAFTVLEFVIVLVVVGILGGIASTGASQYVERARGVEALAIMKNLEGELEAYLASNGQLPDSLADLGIAVPTDPWGNPYRYTNLGTSPPGKARKDKFLVPINSDFDLWSMGPDGKSVPPLTAKSSRDDIIRASDGAYYGRASAF